MPKEVIFDTVQPQDHRATRGHERSYKVVLPLTVWREVQRRCERIGFYAVQNDVFQSGREDMNLAQALRRILPNTEPPDVRELVKQVVALAEMRLGVKVSITEAGRNDWSKRTPPTVPAAVASTPDLPPLEGIFRPR
jgi:hypothetical protein